MSIGQRRMDDVSIEDSYDKNYSIEIHKELGGDIAVTAIKEEEKSFRSVTVVLNPEDAGALLGILMRLRGIK